MTAIPTPPFTDYADPEMHRVMIHDRVRTEAFRDAIQAVVKPGDVVLDIGAGAGILSLFAARAGAAKVYAVERTSAARIAEAVVTANGLDGTVEVIEDDVMSLELPSGVDVVVSEWLGGFGDDENFLEAVLTARDRWLKPKGAMIPGHVATRAALVWEDRSAEALAFFRSRPYGFDLDTIAARMTDEVTFWSSRLSLGPDALRSNPATLWTTDAVSIAVEDVRRGREGSVRLDVPRAGTASAIALWFDAELAPGISLGCGPEDPPTHWGATTSVLAAPVDLEPGAVADLRARNEPAVPGATWTSWSIRFGDGPWETHDERRVWGAPDHPPVGGRGAPRSP